MPRGASKRIGAAVRYDPTARREPVPHARDTRLARSQAPSLFVLPSEILTDILRHVPWQTARRVCRTFAACRPVPRLGVLQGEATRAVARMVHHIANTVIDAYEQHIKRIGESDQRYAPAIVQWARSIRREKIRDARELRRALSHFDGNSRRFIVCSDSAGTLAIDFWCSATWDWPRPALMDFFDVKFDLSNEYCNHTARLLWRQGDRLGHLTRQDLSLLFALYHCTPGLKLGDIFEHLPQTFAEDWRYDARIWYHGMWRNTIEAVRSGASLPHTALEVDAAARTSA